MDSEHGFTHCPFISGLSKMSTLCSWLTSKSRQSIWPSAAVQEVKGKHLTLNSLKIKLYENSLKV